MFSQGDYMVKQTFVQWLDYLKRVKEIRMFSKKKHHKVVLPPNHPWLIKN